MGQRHNRRRTRPRSRNRSINLNLSPIDSSPRPVGLYNSTTALRRSTTACGSLDSIPIHPAPTWHYGYMAWQMRERSPRLETVEMEAEQYRLFGGEPGDDVALCYRMLEYFGGLDYIDCSQLESLPG